MKSGFLDGATLGSSRKATRPHVSLLNVDILECAAGHGPDLHIWAMLNKAHPSANFVLVYDVAWGSSAPKLWVGQ